MFWRKEKPEEPTKDYVSIWITPVKSIANGTCECGEGPAEYLMLFFKNDGKCSVMLNRNETASLICEGCASKHQIDSHPAMVKKYDCKRKVCQCKHEE